MAERHTESELADQSGGPFPTDAGKPLSPGSLPSTLSGSPRPGSTPGSAAARSPQKGGAYWFASAGEDAGDHSRYSAHDYNAKECYWFAHAAELPSPIIEQQKTTVVVAAAATAATTTTGDDDDFDFDADGRDQLDREERVRLLRERQSEERQRRIDEIKLATLHAQKVREEQEEKRRHKLEELKSRDYERRALVEERKKQIWEAEKERKEAILKRNLDREARIEALRNANRSSIGFAFGSSTPRLLEGEQGFFSSRRATSQSNMTVLSNSSRNSVEREVVTLVKKRMATSHISNHRAGDAGSFAHYDVEEEELKVGDPRCSWNGLEAMSSSFTSTAGRLLELFPFSRANRFCGNLTGSGVIVGDDLMTKSCSALLSGPPSNRGRRKTDLIPTIPAHDSPRTQSPATRTTPSSPSRPNSSMSQQSLSSHASQSSTVSMRNRMSSRRPRPVSIAGTPTAEQNRMTAEERLGRSTERRSTTPTGKPPRAKSAGPDHLLSDAGLSAAKPSPAPRKPPTPSTKAAKPLPSAPKPTTEKPKIPPKPAKIAQRTEARPSLADVAKTTSFDSSTNSVDDDKASSDDTATLSNGDVGEKPVEPKKPTDVGEAASNGVDGPKVLEEGSTAPSKTRITTEEEAKAAMTERRRLAREQAEREAELERQRLEEQKRQELERLRLEEEERQRWECEQDLLRQAEDDRLQRAIEEQRTREEEAREKREEDARLKQEREEAERKAREEQEILRKETEERLRREEEERAERRKRVEAIMSRTRNKGTNNTPVTTPTKAEESISEKFEEKTANAELMERLNDASSDSPLVVGKVDLAPSEESVVRADLLENSLPPEGLRGSFQSDPSQLTQQQQQQQQLIDLDGHEVQLMDDSPSLFFNNSQPQKTEALVDLPRLMGDVIPLHTNGFGEKDKPDFVVGGKSCDTKTNLIDSYGEFDLLKARPSPPPSSSPQPLVEFEQLIDLGLVSTTTTNKTDEFLNNADNVNSNLLPANNGPGNPFIAFEDNFVQKQETNISDL